MKSMAADMQPFLSDLPDNLDDGGAVCHVPFDLSVLSTL